ncbi:hypothetical protein ATE80_30180 [Streptomyces kanasensis]|uniref:Uncharacterized protein n=1 Tax=Streptomyces kanasensis TaxID=936756 RepID=A0A100Y064_9ACTN|nr:hypothetical protein ATE80_30180 [Streptomyces kanasensis]
MVNGTAMITVANGLALAERTRALPWSEEREQAARAAYLARQPAGGAYPRLAELLAGAPAPEDPDGAFDRALRRLLDSFG